MRADDLAPTFCVIAGIEPAPWMQGCPLPTSEDGSRQRMLCEWDSQFPGHGMHLRSIYRDGWLLTTYEPSTVGEPTGFEAMMGDWALNPCGVTYDGSEGEPYDVRNDPYQWRNLWDEPRHRTMRADLIADLYAALPEARAARLRSRDQPDAGAQKAHGYRTEAPEFA